MAFISSSTIQIIAAIAFLASSARAQISSGYATYSNGDGGVCSGGGGLPSVSLNAAQFANGAACGQCVQISGTGSGAGKDPVSTAPYIARIGNVCPQCNFGDIDLQESGDGKFGITWSFVGCPGAGRKLIEEPFQGDKTVYTNGEHTETEQEAAAPKQSEKSEKHFIVQQAQNGHFIHQKQDQPVAPSTIEESAQDNTAEVQAPSADQVEEEPSAKATQETDDVHPTTQDVEQEEVVQKTSRRLLMN